MCVAVFDKNRSGAQVPLLLFLPYKQIGVRARGEERDAELRAHGVSSCHQQDNGGQGQQAEDEMPNMPIRPDHREQHESIILI